MVEVARVQGEGIEDEGWRERRAKGLEADRVWILEDTLKRGGQEELNICYVAYTRARKELCLVSINKPMEELEEVTREQSLSE
jgi:superfamily I DNA/RNA helicase